MTLSRQGFAGIGKAIHEVREQIKQLQKQSIGRQHEVSLTRSRNGEKRSHRYQTQGTQKDVAIDRKELPLKNLAETEPRHAETMSRPAFTISDMERFISDIVLSKSHKIHGILGIVPPPDPHGERQAGILRHHSAQSHASHLHATDKDEEKTQHNVQNVLHKRHSHGYPRVLQTNIPPVESVKHQHCRRTPYTYIIIGTRLSFHSFSSVYEA